MKLKKIIKESHMLGELPSSKLMKMKWNPLTESEPDPGDYTNTDVEPIKERLSSGMLKRFEGLHNQRHMKAMLNAASLLHQEMEDEGFDSPDIYEFLIYKINKTNL